MDSTVQKMRVFTTFKIESELSLDIFIWRIFYNHDLCSVIILPTILDGHESLVTCAKLRQSHIHQIMDVTRQHYTSNKIMFTFSDPNIF